MKVDLQRVPWYDGELTEEALGGIQLLAGAWREATERFTTMQAVRKAASRPAAMGIQASLNEVIDERFHEAGWEGDQARFRMANTWFRITFRHQMGLGSDFLDAVRLSSLEGIEQCVILGAPLEFLRVISPKDAGSLCSFEKIALQASRLEGAVAPPLLIGALKPVSQLPKSVSMLVYGSRLRH